MTQKPSISAQATRQFLHKRLDKEVAELTLLSGGDWSQAYSFVSHNKKYVLRWCNSSETFDKEAAASMFSCQAMPIPQIIDSGIAFDTYFAVSEFAPGKFIDTLTAAELEDTLPALFALFDALKNTDLTNTTGYGGWNRDGVGSHKSWKEFLLSVKDDHAEDIKNGWYADLAKSSVGTDVFDRLYLQLASLVEKCPEVRELIHSDLLHYNLLVSDARISAVIDWQCSLYGDSLYDVAWFIYYAPVFPQFAAVQLCQKAIAHFEAVNADNSNLKTRLLCYQLNIGLGSIVYNIFRKDWKAVQEDTDYTLKISRQTNNF